uniref:Acetyl-coenzyme A synthetase n=1 Tax=Meleagris gallopavo TaxID=9103 RepID=A0A803YEQ8_MELGA
HTAEGFPEGGGCLLPGDFQGKAGSGPGQPYLAVHVPVHCRRFLVFVLCLNLCFLTVNCLDQHVEKSPNRVALIWERDEPGTAVHVTYRELLDLTCRLANTLKKYGIQKGDKVAIYMSVSPLSVAAMLACARIGAVHTVVFAGFSSESLAGRIMDSECKAVITYNQGVRGGRIIELKMTVDEAVKNCPSVKHVFVAQRTDNKTQMGDLDVPLEEEMAKAASVCTPESMDSEDMLFMLYTSGSTGKPKGIVHTQAGYLLYAALTHKYVFDYRQGDVFGCVADIGWITGHSYVVYGPLCNGGTTVLFESTPVYPDPGRYWEMVQRLKINQFYGAPTAIRLLLNYGDKWVKKYDRSSLKTLGSVGEPINNEAWQWFYHVVGEGRCTLVDTWWQTETGGICIAPRPSEEKADIIPAMAMRPFFGIFPVLMDENGRVLEGNDVSGALCITEPWPGLARTIYRDHQRFVDTYFKAYPGYYFTGDGAYRTKEGYYQITGRMDDVINISGHRLGTAEIEDAMADHPDVPETAVIGYPHEIKGEGRLGAGTATFNKPCLSYLLCCSCLSLAGQRSRKRELAGGICGWRRQVHWSECTHPCTESTESTFPGKSSWQRGI